MNYRIKYIYKGTRDKGQEIMDYYGTYQIYELIQEDTIKDNTEYTEYLNQSTVSRTYEAQFNPTNKLARKAVREDSIHKKVEVYEAEPFQTDKFKITGAEWKEKYEPVFDYENNPQAELLDKKIIGTELANFLNFDIDRFMYGGHSILWNYDELNERDIIVGWKKEEGHNLNDLSVREEVSSYMIHGNREDNETENIPFFIRMFGCKFIDTNQWIYNMEEVEKIKALQERIRKFCEKVFFPADSQDKRTNFERYCEQIDTIDKKELRKRVPKDWFVPSSLEQALAYECYAMVKGNVNFFQCENCGLYTVANDNRSRLCDRLYYDGTVYDVDTDAFHEYWYVCKEEQYLKTLRDKISGNLIKSITEYEKKRLYNHIDFHLRLQKIKEKLIIGFGNIVFENEEQYIIRLSVEKDEKAVLQIANEYLKLIGDRMNELLSESLGSAMKEKYLFTRKKNVLIKSVSGNIFE